MYKTCTFLYNILLFEILNNIMENGRVLCMLKGVFIKQLDIR